MSTSEPDWENIIPEDWDEVVETYTENMQAEAQSRQLWFGFELDPVELEYQGDWTSFYQDKLAEETALKQEWEKHGVEILPHNITIESYEEARAIRLLDEEFQRVVVWQKDSARTFATQVLALLKNRNYPALAGQSGIIDASASDRLALSEQLLREKQPTYKKAVFEFEQCQHRLTHIHFVEPEPHAGMPAKAEVTIGESDYRVELYWSGPVMPHANGPKYAKPEQTISQSGHWLFSHMITPDTPEAYPLQ
ncbi:MAG: hypothetical protein OEZ39_16900 [Gammaproteobacteria bacterium]|nr:hypothetical protein [Gammaproteobacteria bacterium]MDH5653540.1 hypothetical protein [Gammaproteobacteria bacterium]